MSRPIPRPVPRPGTATAVLAAPAGAGAGLRGLPAVLHAHVTASPIAAGIALTAAAAVIIATLGTVSHLAYDAGLTPIGFATWRGFLGAALLLAFVVARRAAGGPSLAFTAMPRAQRLALAGATAANLGLTLALFTAYDKLPVAVAVLIYYSYPAIVAVVGALTGRDRMTASRAVAIGVALGGVALVVAARLDLSGGVALDGIGLACAAGAALGKTVYLLVSRAGYNSVPPEQAVLVILLGCGIGAAIAALATGQAAALLAPFAHPAAWPLIGLGATISGAIPMTLFIAGARRLPSTRTAIVMLAEPTTSVGIAAIVLGQSIVPLQVLGAVLVLAGGVAVQRGDTGH